MKELKYLDITKANQGHIKVPSVEGMYPDMGAGRAEAIVTNIHDTNSVPYVFRKTPYRSTRETDKLVGASVAWNQLYSTTSFDTGTVNDVVFTKATGSITMNGLASANVFKALSSAMSTVSGHKYYVKGADTAITGCTFYDDSSTRQFNGLTTATVFSSSGASINFKIRIASGTSVNATICPQVVDLTLALGSTIADYIYTLESGTAGAGIAKLREWGFFDKPYYAYNAGGIESVNVSKHRMVGFNQWDEEWEQGHYSTAGVLNATSNAIHSKNFTPCFPNTDYYCYLGKTGAQTFLCWYDNGQNFISRSAYINNGKRTSPANAAYFKMTTDTNYGTVYLDDICISIDKGTNVGIYEPYKVNEYPLADVTLRGIFKLDGSNNLYSDGDVYESDGTHKTNYRMADLGTLNWSAPSGTGQVSASDDIGAVPVPSGAVPNAIAYGYVATTNGSSADKALRFSSSGLVRLTDSAFVGMTAAQVKTALSGVYMVYPLATPTTETVDPFTNPQVCSPYGTEEYVDRAVAAGTRDVSIPCGHETEYAKDIVGAIEGIPFPPSSNGTYTLKVTVTSGVPTYSWVSE